MSGREVVRLSAVVPADKDEVLSQQNALLFLKHLIVRAASSSFPCMFRSFSPQTGAYEAKRLLVSWSTQFKLIPFL